MQIETTNLLWNASDDGSKNAPPLVLLHGFAQTLNSFAPMISKLAERFRVIRFDLPGHGKTKLNTNCALEWPLLCDNLHEAVAKIDSRPAHWFGYSQGGRVALMCAFSQPDRVKSLALLGASVGIPNVGERELRRQSDQLLGQNIVGRGMAWFANYWEALPIFATQKYLPEPARQHIRSERMACSPSGLKFALDSYGTGTMPDCFEQAISWRKPLFLSAGELDTKFAESNSAVAEISTSVLLRHHVFLKCGHAAHLERPDEFTNLLIEFYKSQKDFSHE